MFKSAVIGSLLLTLVILISCDRGSSTSDPVPPPPQSFTIGGTVSGLSASELVLSNNSIDLIVTANGAFSLAGDFVSGTAYAVTVAVQPSSPEQTCTVANGSGVVGNSNVSDISVSCVTTPVSQSLVPSVISSTVATNLFDSTKFIYSGDNAVQTGVGADTIKAHQVSIVRGQVFNSTGAVLPGVKISVLNQAQYGATLSREDGWFDLAVNGGGPITLQYELVDHLTSQRHVTPKWQSFVSVPDVVLIQLDPVASEIDLLSADAQMAVGSVNQDDDGTRQSRTLFKSGTSVEIVLPGGGRQSVDQITVRATEYTLGDSGPKAMPGSLPVSSGYTFAVELSVDEALAMGSNEVVFNKPVINYTSNFLGFDVGEIVPVGYYDRAQGKWIASPNGRVIAILSIDNGIAAVDINGDGGANTTVELDAFGIDSIELEQLALNYQAGDELWRVSMDHFTPWDMNWPVGPPADAVGPTSDAPAAPDENAMCEQVSEQSGSIIECQNQVLGESIAVVGTPYTLNYRSNRVADRKSENIIRIPLSGDDVPASLKQIHLEVYIAGQILKLTVPGLPNQSHTFEWDGFDVYGRKINGAATALVRIGYEYDAVYYYPNTETQADFGQAGAAIAATIAREPYIFWSNDEVVVNAAPTTKDIGLGGWMLDVHHQYDPISRTVHFGSGNAYASLDDELTLSTIAGDGTDNLVGQVSSLAVDKEGNVYLGDFFSKVVWKITPDGEQSLFAGVPNSGCQSNDLVCGDGGLANQTKIGSPLGLDVGPDGSVYIVSAQSVRRVTPDGIINRVAGVGGLDPADTDGGGFSESTGDGGPAVDAQLSLPQDVAVAEDGTVYISEQRRIRQVGTDGVIRTVAGDGTFGTAGEGGLAVAASISPRALAVSPEGELYIAETGRVLMLGRDGLLKLIASNSGGICFENECGDGLQAIQANVESGGGLAFSRGGDLLIASEYSVRSVNANGVIKTIAGGMGSSACNVANVIDGVNALAAPLCMENYLKLHLATGPDGSIYAANNGNFNLLSVFKFSPSLPTFTDSAISVVSRDGQQLFDFDRAGRHLQTRSAITGVTLFSFIYDETTGGLLSVTDVNGLTTTIERDSGGQPLAIIGNYGQRTMLSVDANGYLASIITPNNLSHGFIYTAGGLLTDYNDANGNTAQFFHDEFGRLALDQDVEGGHKAIAREITAVGHSVSLTTALDRVTRYDIERKPEGGLRFVDTRPDGARLVREIDNNEVTTVTQADGTVTQAQFSADPRFGMQAPFQSALSINYPSGLQTSVSRTRTVQQANSDPMSFTFQSDIAVVNGRQYQTTFDVATKTYNRISPEGRQLTWTIDEAGRPLVMTVAGLQPYIFEYDELGRTVRSAQGERSLDQLYDNLGRLSVVTDANSSQIEFSYDADDRLTQVKNQTFDDTDFSYDQGGRNKTLTTANQNTHSFTYTNLNQIASYSAPELAAGPTSATYEYNVDSDLTRMVDEEERNIDIAYDEFGRVSRFTIPTNVINLIYDESTKKLVQLSSPRSILDFSYDGDLPVKTQWSVDVVGSVSKIYDENLWLTQIGVQVGASDEVIDFGYDNDGLLITAGSMPLTRQVNNGLLAATSLNDITENYTYNIYGNIETRSISDSSTAIVQETYTYNMLGQIETINATVDGDISNKIFDYDDLGRLISVSENGLIVESYSYDGNSNRVSVTDQFGSFTGIYDAQDRIQTYGNRSFNFDASGRLIQASEDADTTDYIYDAIGNLLSVSLPSGNVVTYITDPQNRRIGKRINGVDTKQWLYQDSLNPVAELNAAGELVSQFVYGEKNYTPAYMVRDGVSYSIISDQAGSVRLVVNSQTGAVAQRIDYNAFGVVIQDTNPGFQPFGFAGGLYDADTELVRYGARDYDASIGRWLSKDPSGFYGGNPNLYVYAGADPVNFIDPEGKGRIWDAFMSFGDWLTGRKGKNLKAKLKTGLKEEATSYAKGCTTEAIQDFRGGLSKQFNNSGAGTLDYTRYTDSRDAGREIVDAVNTGLDIRSGDAFKEKAKSAIKDFLFSTVGSMFGM